MTTGQPVTSDNTDIAGPRLVAEIKRRRKAAGLTHRELAARIGYTRPHISRAESGNVAPSEPLVKALDGFFQANGALYALHTQAKAEQHALRHHNPPGPTSTNTKHEQPRHQMPALGHSTAQTATEIGRPGAELAATDASGWAETVGHALPEALTAALVTSLESLAPAAQDELTPRERDRAYHHLVGFLSGWAHTMDRRDVLRALGWAASAASLPALDSDEQQRVASVLGTPSRVDAQTIEHIEAVLWRCARQDAALGPRAVLDTVLAQRDLTRALVPECPPALRPRMLSALSDASRQAGWLCFDLNQFDHAGYYYEDARALAHEARNIGLGAFVLCEMSHLATWRGTPRIGIDHAVAAEQWAQHTDDQRLHAYTADVAARAYAADNQQKACLNALDTAHTALTAADNHTPSLSTYDEAIHIAHRGLCHLELREGQLAIEYTQQSLGSLDQSNARNIAFATVHLGMAYAHCNEIDEAARLFGEAGDIAARNSSARLTERLTQARAELRPWAHTTPVRQLDDRLTSNNTA